MSRIANVICTGVLAMTAGACPALTDTPDSMLGTWTRVDVHGVLDPASTTTYGLDNIFETTGIDNQGQPFTSTGTWRRVDASTLEHCLDGAVACSTQYIVGPDEREVFLRGSDYSLLRGPTEGLADTIWRGSYSACCANGSEWHVSLSLELNGDGGAAYVARPSSTQGPTGMTWNGTWTEAALGVAFSGGSPPMAGRIRIGDWMAPDAYRRTVDLR